MSQDEDHQRTVVYAEMALDHIRRNRIPAYPRFYELWYTYAAGFNQSLNRAVNTLLHEHGDMALDDLQAIYNQFLSPHRLGDRIGQVGGQFSSELKDTMELLTRSANTTANYGALLEEACSALENAHEPDVVKAIAAHLLQATREARLVNLDLERQIIESRRQIKALHENLEAIRHESLTDELTTLHNRKHFDHILERMVCEAADANAPLALLLTDIDHFKQFNDNYGHQTGDQVLRLVALAVKHNVKGHDITCRYGGEEFAIILPNTGLSQAVTVAEHIRRAVISKELVKRSTGEHLGRITISIGVAAHHPKDTAQSLIARADAALYAAKRAGRNCVRDENDVGVLPRDDGIQVA